MTIDEKAEATEQAKEQQATLEARAADSGANATAAFRKKQGQALEVPGAREPAGHRGARSHPRGDPQAPRHLRRVRRAQEVAHPGR
ncbi:hypothetical protein GCM10025862_40690 [Arsenicicoccus piscis]|uniref:Uncharacterized protein n=1 Tax=Arsenicicoccus piscis TaxID=673954 RepID=A0ABQ6HU42_9MICO|nr:hypothetical protein GCM10025862_40690 [Arsenicicoccus piscis]